VSDVRIEIKTEAVMGDSRWFGEDVAVSLSPYGQRVDVPLDPDPESERNEAGPGNLLTFMAASDMHEHEAADLNITDRDLANQLPPEHSSVSADGRMDVHRKPIVSINGKDIDEHQERQRDAA
jgi:hypothetical protein